MGRTASATRYAIQVDGRDLFLFAGDFPYFRLHPRLWADTLAKLRAAHLNAVTVSAPWNWHEPDEGEFDLQGESHPQRNLDAALSLCAEQGLYVIFRPGPHIGGGWRHGGIPDWLLRAHPEILALDAQDRRPGLEMRYPPITYLHPAYETAVAGWYQAFLPLLRRSLVSEQGTVAAVVIDDRPSYWWGLQEGDPLFVDYNPHIVGHNGRPGLYQRWLALQYGDVQRLNRRYHTHYEAFEQVQPPRRPPASYHELPWFSDWRRCKMYFLNQHLEYLYDWLREGGLDVPVAILYPYQAPLAARRCADYFRMRDKPVLVAHAANAYPTREHRADELALGQAVGLAELARGWVKDMGLPPANLETPGSVSPRVPADGVEALCVLQVGHGLAALSLSPMAGGESPPGYSLAAGRLFGQGAPISPRGHLRPHYGAVRRLGQFLQLHGERLLRTEPLADLAFAWYEPYEDCGQQGDARALGWRDDYRDMLAARFGLPCGRWQGDGGDLLTLMAMSGLNYAMLDLERDPLEEWFRYPQLWVPGLDFMAASAQRDLISYVQAGGHLVMLPRVPYLDEDLNPCALLDTLYPARPLHPEPGWPTGHRRMPFHAIALDDGRDLGAADYVDTFDLPPGCEALAWEWHSCRPCAYRTIYGQGSATLLGFTLAPLAESAPEHKHFVNELANRAHVRRHATSEALRLHVVERATPAGSPDPAGYLFVVNPWSQPVRSRLTYTDPVTGQAATLPRLLKGVEFNSQGALILCLETPIPGTGLTIAYSTSQVEGWSVDGDRLLLTLYGPPDTMGETAFRVCLPAGAPSVAAPLHSERISDEAGEITIVTYPHHQGTTILRLRM